MAKRKPDKRRLTPVSVPAPAPGPPLTEREDGLPTIEHLIKGNGGNACRPEDLDVSLGVRERIDIAAMVAEHSPDGDWRSNPGLAEKILTLAVETFGGGRPGKIDRVREWVDTLRTDPGKAWTRLRHTDELPTVATVVREDQQHEPSTQELSDFVRRHKPDLAKWASDESEIALDFKRSAYRDWADQCTLPPIPAGVKIDAIRHELAWHVRRDLGRYLEGGKRQIDQALHRLVAGAVKVVLGCPRDEVVGNDSRWDIPQCHVVLQRPDIQQAIRGWVRGKLIRGGHCPRLARVFDIERQ